MFLLSKLPVAVRNAFLVALFMSAGVWIAVDLLHPGLPPMVQPAARLAFAIKWICVAVLFCLVGGIEAVAHERLQTDAFDPLAGHETRRLQVNLRYLQNSLEQIVVFAFGVLGLAVLDNGEAGLRAIAATSVVWILSRFAFWIGYHRSAAWRVVGLTGLAQSLVVLLYACARFAFEAAGWAGASALLIAYGALELFLVFHTRSPVAAAPSSAARPR